MSHFCSRKRGEVVRGVVEDVEAGAERSRMMMLLCREWRSRAVARPMPEEPPVIRMVL